MRVGVSFSIPIEDLLKHVELVLSDRVDLQKHVHNYERVVTTLKNSEEGVKAPEMVDVIGRLTNIRRGLFEADQAMEDTINVLAGYIDFLQQESVTPAAPVPPEQPQVEPTVTPPEGDDDA